jgi:hypothetical protein
MRILQSERIRVQLSLERADKGEARQLSLLVTHIEN